MAAPSAVICFAGFLDSDSRKSRQGSGRFSLPQGYPRTPHFIALFESFEPNRRVSGFPASTDQVDGGRPAGDRSVHLVRDKQLPTHLPTTSAILRSAALSFTLLNAVPCSISVISQPRTLHTLSKQAPLGRIWRIGFSVGRCYTSPPLAM
jgi:hypothetical protein